jgi:hypothetical protein
MTNDPLFWINRAKREWPEYAAYADRRAKDDGVVNLDTLAMMLLPKSESLSEIPPDSPDQIDRMLLVVELAYLRLFSVELGIVAACGRDLDKGDALQTVYHGTLQAWAARIDFDIASEYSPRARNYWSAAQSENDRDMIPMAVAKTTSNLLNSTDIGLMMSAATIVSTSAQLVRGIVVLADQLMPDWATQREE